MDALLFEDALEKRKSSEPSGGVVCVICFDEVTAATGGRALDCAHVYHPHCIEGWLNRAARCPQCQYPVPEAEAQVAAYRAAAGFGDDFTRDEVSRPVSRWLHLLSAGCHTAGLRLSCCTRWASSRRQRARRRPWQLLARSFAMSRPCSSLPGCSDADQSVCVLCCICRQLWPINATWSSCAGIAWPRSRSFARFTT